MTDINLSKKLKEFGLSDEEARIYLALLKLIEAPVFKIAQETNIPRTNCYKILENLKKEEIVMSFKKNGVMNFTPENPNIFSEKLKRKKEAIEEALPGMREIIDSAGKNPDIAIYYGDRGIKKIWKDILETCHKKQIKEVLAISSPDVYKRLPRFFPLFIEKRQRLGVGVKIILPDSKEARLEGQKYLREPKFLPPGQQIDCSLDIYGDKAALISHKEDEPIGIIIDSFVMTNLLKTIFMSMWRLL